MDVVRSAESGAKTVSLRTTGRLYSISFGIMGTFTKGEVKCAPTWKSRAKRQSAKRA